LPFGIFEAAPWLWMGESPAHLLVLSRPGFEEAVRLALGESSHARGRRRVTS
jgi:hypothetical protein